MRWVKGRDAIRRGCEVSVRKAVSSGGRDALL